MVAIYDIQKTCNLRLSMRAAQPCNRPCNFCKSAIPGFVRTYVGNQPYAQTRNFRISRIEFHAHPKEENASKQSIDASDDRSVRRCRRWFDRCGLRAALVAVGPFAGAAAAVARWRSGRRAAGAEARAAGTGAPAGAEEALGVVHPLQLAAELFSFLTLKLLAAPVVRLHRVQKLVQLFVADLWEVAGVQRGEHQVTHPLLVQGLLALRRPLLLRLSRQSRGNRRFNCLLRLGGKPVEQLLILLGSGHHQIGAKTEALPCPDQLAQSRIFVGGLTNTVPGWRRQFFEDLLSVLAHKFAVPLINRLALFVGQIGEVLLEAPLFLLLNELFNTGDALGWIVDRLQSGALERIEVGQPATITFDGRYQLIGSRIATYRCVQVAQALFISVTQFVETRLFASQSLLLLPRHRRQLGLVFAKRLSAGGARKRCPHDGGQHDETEPRERLPSGANSRSEATAHRQSPPRQTGARAPAPSKTRRRRCSCIHPRARSPAGRGRGCGRRASCGGRSRRTRRRSTAGRARPAPTTRSSAAARPAFAGFWNLDRPARRPWRRC